MTQQEPKRYSNEWKRSRLLAGEKVHFSKHGRRKARTIPAEWVAKAVRAGAKLDIENAIITGPLTFRYTTFTDEVWIRGTEIQEAADFEYATFQRVVDFRGSTFQQGADFYSATFESDVFLNEARFLRGRAGFRDVKVRGGFAAYDTTFARGVVADFHRTSFSKTAHFARTVFGANVDFASATFGDQAIFNRATFRGATTFSSASVGGSAFFGRATFADEASFIGATFADQAVFSGATFHGKVTFNSCQIDGAAFFNRARFKRDADFVSIHIGQTGGFDRTIFRGATIFSGASIGGSAFFPHATFGGEASFTGTTFAVQAIFNRATFRGAASFGTARIQGRASFRAARFAPAAPASFDGVHFLQGASFQHTVFQAPANFRTACFEVEAAFDRTTFEAGANFDHARFLGDASFAGTDFAGPLASFRETTFRTVFFTDDEQAGATTQTAHFSAATHADLRGCTYDRIEIDDRRSWLAWVFPPLSALGRPRAGPICWQSLLARLRPWDRQPYTQMEAAFRTAGRETTADNIYFHGRWQQGRKTGLLTDPVGLLLLTLVGYGVRRWYLLLWSAVVLLIGAWVFHAEGAVVPANLEEASATVTQQCPGPQHTDCRLSVPDSSWFALNRFLPVGIDVGGGWAPSSGRFELLATALQIAGWVFIPVGVAAFTGILQRGRARP